MAVLHMTLTEEGVTFLRDALLCLAKFSEEVTIEARRDQFSLSTITVSKNAYANFSFSTTKCFTRYRFEGNAQFREKFFCTLYMRTLIAILRPRSSNVGSSSEKQSAYERCEISVQDGPDIKSRFMAKFIFRNGITTRHRIPFESKRPMHAKFNAAEAANMWAMSAGTLRELTEQHVSTGADLLDIHGDEDNVMFTYYTEGALVDNEALRTPLHTVIAVDAEDFDALELESELHIVMTTKDFRAIVHHASLAGSSIIARYSVPGRPLQFSYQADGVACEFIVMTAGDRGTSDKRISHQRKDGRADRSGSRHKMRVVSNIPQAQTQTQAQPQPQTQTQPQTLGAASHRRSSVAPLEAQRSGYDGQLSMITRTTATPVGGTNDEPTPMPRASASRFAGFDLRPTQMPTTQMRLSDPMPEGDEGLFVDDDRQWQSLDAQDAEAEQLGEEDARLEWTYDVDESSSHSRSGTTIRKPQRSGTMESGNRERATSTDLLNTSIEPTQRLSDVAGLGLFGRSTTR